MRKETLPKFNLFVLVLVRLRAAFKSLDKSRWLPSVPGFRIEDRRKLI